MSPVRTPLHSWWERDTGGLFCVPPWTPHSSSPSHQHTCKPLSSSQGEVGCSLQHDPNHADSGWCSVV